MSKFKVGDKVVRKSGEGWFGSDFLTIKGKAFILENGEQKEYGVFREEKLKLYEEKKWMPIKFEYIEGCYNCIYLKGKKCSNTKLCLDHKGKIIKGEVMSKTFKEVIADIKEGEVWVGDENWNIEYIKSGEEGIEIKFKKEVDRYNFCEAVDFTLQRKKVSFTEAFKAYEEGKEIESCYNKYKFRCLENGHNEFNYDDEWLGVWEVDQIFSINQVRGEWFING